MVTLGASVVDRLSLQLTLVLFLSVVVVTLFTALYPNVMPSSTNPAYSLTIANASSTASTLAVMSWVALGTLPFVLAYQAWTYWVFRKRVGRHSIPSSPQHGAATLPTP